MLESGWLFSSSIDRANVVAPSTEAGYGHRMLVAAYGWLLLCGWYSLPWFVVLVQAARVAQRNMRVSAARLCFIVASLALLGALTPLVSSRGRACLTNATGAFIQNAHFGPIFLSDMDEPGRWGLLGGVEWPLWIWQLLSALSLLSVTALAWWGTCTLLNWFSEVRAGEVDPRTAAAVGFLAMVAVSVLAIIVWIEPHMDRYWLFLFPALSVWWLLLAARYQWRLTRPGMAWAVLCIALWAGMSIVFTHDMLAWNDARWRFVSARLASGMPADAIDAGRDVNAWLRMDEDPDTMPREGDETRWWSGRAKVALAIGARPGWHLVERLPWQAWAIGQTHYLSVLEPDGVATSSAQYSVNLKRQP
jgi:hypothetical protein